MTKVQMWNEKAKEARLEYDVNVYNAKKALGIEDPPGKFRTKLTAVG
jgi:hypothetical protein